MSDADAQLSKWVEAHPRDVVATLYLAQEFGRKGQNKRAIEEYQRALKIDPKNMVALNNLANFYRRENDSRAIAVAEDAYRAHPETAATADTLGWMLIEQGSIPRGLELVQKAAALSPTDTEIRYHLAAALAKAGDREKAKKELEDLLAGNRSFPQREAAQALLKQL